MSDLRLVAGDYAFAALYANADLLEYMSGKAVFVLDFKQLDKGDFTRLCNTLEQGFLTSMRGKNAELVRVLAQASQYEGTCVPQFLELGYVGKKDAHFPVRTEKAQEYRQMLIASAHMLDVDMSKAVSVASQEIDGWRGCCNIYIRGYNVEMHNDPLANTPRWTRRQAGAHLRPMTSRLSDLIRQFTKETLGHRQEIIAFVKQRPIIQWTGSFQPTTKK